jgi:alkylhydroperoxidase family enzyme
MKSTTTQMSRFQIHDELTAPETAQPILRGALGRGGRLPNLLGVLAGAPAALRAYVRFRSELRGGHLQPPTLARIALGVAEHHGAHAAVALHARSARSSAGLTADEVVAARGFSSADPREAALLAWIGAVVAGGRPPMHLHEAARAAGWTDEALLEALAAVGLETFTAYVHLAGDVPADSAKGAAPGAEPRRRALRLA